MKLLSARIGNYKCFRDTGDIEFAPGFNIFIGQNDAGKSALIEALSLTKNSVPHRSLESAPSADTIIDPSSLFGVTYSINEKDLLGHFSKLEKIVLPITTADRNVNIQLAQEAFYDAVHSSDQFTAVWKNAKPESGFLHSLRHLDHKGTYGIFNNLDYPRGVSLSYTSSNTSSGYPEQLAKWLADLSYAFRAERLNLSVTGSRGSDILQPDARNLGEVLNWLTTTDRYLFDELIGHVRAIFPHVTEIKAPLLQSNEIKVMVSTVEPRLSRRDLDVPLESSGTGIGQVLAMLYVVVTRQTPHLILIDEPQSFLHPGAARKLMEILRQYPKHQYVLTTHSPVALTSSDADRLFLVARRANVGVISSVTDRDELKTALADVGVRLSDVFGAESVLWVEGRTEESCFPDLIRALGNKSLHGTIVLGVVNTGDLAGKHAARAFEVYERLSSSSALLPRPVAFLFDREQRTERDMQDLTRQSGGLMHWLPLRMYENYLLQPEAIAAVINSIDQAREQSVTASAVTGWLERNGSLREYLPPSSTQEFGTPEWEKTVDGAKVLDGLFAELTDSSYTYDKVRHGEMLTRYLIDHPTDKLIELAQLLASLLPS
jgi:AAA domain, putative AbiEii toxin, Type IV TA system/AAA ATPase domain